MVITSFNDIWTISFIHKNFKILINVKNLVIVVYDIIY